MVGPSAIEFTSITLLSVALNAVEIFRVLSGNDNV